MTAATAKPTVIRRLSTFSGLVFVSKSIVPVPPRLLKEDQPQRECEKCGKARISHNRQIKIHVESQQHQSADSSEENSYHQTEQPGGEKRAQDIDGRSSSATCKQQRSECQHVRHQSALAVCIHGRAVALLG